MNKAFTANINDQVTARGYLDENDQLIMLEPEGSGGGGGEIETATLTVTGNIEGVSANIPAILEMGESAYITALTSIEVGNSYNIPIYMDGAALVLRYSERETVTITGDYTVVESSEEFTVYAITGDCTVNIVGVN